MSLPTLATRYAVMLHDAYGERALETFSTRSIAERNAANRANILAPYQCPGDMITFSVKPFNVATSPAVNAQESLLKHVAARGNPAETASMAAFVANLNSALADVDDNEDMM